ncbi:MAG: hypothetical protein R3F11_09945 [Verrucomicrobiales bacterium]
MSTSPRRSTRGSATPVCFRQRPRHRPHLRPHRRRPRVGLAHRGAALPDLVHGFRDERWVHRTLPIPGTPWVAVCGLNGARFFDSRSGLPVAAPVIWYGGRKPIFGLRPAAGSARMVAPSPSAAATR